MMAQATLCATSRGKVLRSCRKNCRWKLKALTVADIWVSSVIDESSVTPKTFKWSDILCQTQQQRRGSASWVWQGVAQCRTTKQWPTSSGAATVGVVGVRTPPKIQVGVSDTHKKVNGEYHAICCRPTTSLVWCNLLPMDALYK